MRLERWGYEPTVCEDGMTARAVLFGADPPPLAILDWHMPGVQELQTALTLVNQLSGMLPICSYCKKIRREGNQWEQLETYLSEHSEAEFSHGVCPTCLERASKEFGLEP